MDKKIEIFSDVSKKAPEMNPETLLCTGGENM